MDKFEETMTKLASMKPDDQKSFMLHKRRLCMCSHCTTYTDCARNSLEAVYCLKGKSPACIKAEKGCVCMTCPVFFELGLKRTFYCTRGGETERRAKEKK